MQIQTALELIDPQIDLSIPLEQYESEHAKWLEEHYRAIEAFWGALAEMEAPEPHWTDVHHDLQVLHGQIAESRTKSMSSRVNSPCREWVQSVWHKITEPELEDSGGGERLRQLLRTPAYGMRMDLVGVVSVAEKTYYVHRYCSADLHNVSEDFLSGCETEDESLQWYFATHFYEGSKLSYESSYVTANLYTISELRDGEAIPAADLAHDVFWRIRNDTGAMECLFDHGRIGILVKDSPLLIGFSGAQKCYRLHQIDTARRALREQGVASRDERAFVQKQAAGVDASIKELDDQIAQLQRRKKDLERSATNIKASAMLEFHGLKLGQKVRHRHSDACGTIVTITRWSDQRIAILQDGQKLDELEALVKYRGGYDAEGDIRRGYWVGR